MDSVIKAIVIFVVLWAVIRLTGRRTLSQLTVFEFVLFVIIGGVAQRALSGEDFSLTHAVVIVATLAGLDVLVSLAGRESILMRKILKGAPMIVIENGRPLGGRMRRARVTEDEIMEAARRDHGIMSLTDVKFAILETSGQISIVPWDRPRAGAKPAKPQMRRVGGELPRDPDLRNGDSPRS